MKKHFNLARAMIIMCIVMTAASSFGITFDYNCHPMYSPVDRNGLFATMKVQSYSWTLFNKAVPTAARKKFYSLTFFGMTMSENGSASDTGRWTGLVKDLWDDCYRFDWIAGDIRPDNACTGDNFKERTSGHAELTIYNNYCQAKMPTSVAEMFELNEDLPGEFVNMWDASYLQSNYTPENPSVGEKTGKDFDTFFQLNLEAEKLWREILACADGDSERARLAVAEGGSICGVKEKLKSLIINTVNYFSSAQAIGTPFYDSIGGKYIPGTISNDSPLLAGMYEFGGREKYISDMKWDGVKRNPLGEFWIGQRARQYQNSEFFESRYTERIAKAKQKYPDFSILRILNNRVQIHPLFSQIVMEILATEYLSTDLITDFGKINKSKYMNDWRAANNPNLKPELQNLHNNISDFALVYLERMCEPTGLWPSAGFSAMLYIQRQISIGLAATYDKRFPTEDPMPENSSDYMRIGYWAGDYGRAQLNCNRGKVLPEIYYKNVKGIVKYYRKMFRRHISD